MNLQILPVELWEIILGKFERDGDPVQLVRLKRVCKVWYAIISQMLDKTGITWFEKCLRSIPPLFWSSILDAQHHPGVNCKNFQEAKKQTQVWIALHCSWVEWQGLMANTPVIEILVEMPRERNSERITCIAALSNLVAVGDSKGYVKFYNITKSHGIPFYEVNHGNFVQEVQFWRKGDEITAVSSCVTHIVKYWDIIAKKPIEKDYDSRGSLLTASFEYSYTIEDDDKDGNHKATLLNVEKITQSMAIDRRRLQLNFEEKTVATVGDGNKIMLWVEGNRHIKYVETPTEMYTLHPYMIRRPLEPNFRYLTFKPHVLAFIGEERYFGFSIAARQWKVYDSLEKFRYRVTAILFHIVLLIVGLSSGDLHIFHIKDYRTNLENYDFRLSKSKLIALDREPIISLKVAEHNMERYIIAASKRKVYSVKFPRLTT